VLADRLSVALPHRIGGRMGKLLEGKVAVVTGSGRGI
jgi:hypothetical protein